MEELIDRYKTASGEAADGSGDNRMVSSSSYSALPSLQTTWRPARHHVLVLVSSCYLFACQLPITSLEHS